MPKKEYHTYECSNWYNDYSGQRYPIHINSVTHVDITNKWNPNGKLCVSVEDVDGHFCTILKAYKNTQGERYCNFGKHRLYEGFRGGVELVNVPYGVRDAIISCGGTIR